MFTRQREHGHHMDDWLVTYADMITLLLCFFAVFLSVSLHGKLTATPAPLPPPAIVTQKEEIVVEVKHGEPIRQAIPVFLYDDKVEADPETLAEKVIAAQPPAEPVRMPERVALAVTEKAKPVQAPAPQAQEPSGDRLTSIEANSAAFFAAGSADLSAQGKEILKGIAAQIKSDEYKDYQVTVEGHTDDTPIKTKQFPSNWELSTARASAVVHYFLEQGIAPQRLRAAGYADTFPKAPNRDASGRVLPDNQAANRRVVIKMEKIERG